MSPLRRRPRPGPRGHECAARPPASPGGRTPAGGGGLAPGVPPLGPEAASPASSAGRGRRAPAALRIRAQSSRGTAETLLPRGPRRSGGPPGPRPPSRSGPAPTPGPRTAQRRGRRRGKSGASPGEAFRRGPGAVTLTTSARRAARALPACLARRGAGSE